MKFFAGFDGGATKTKCVITDEQLNILAEAKGDASNFLIIGVDTVAETIIKLLEKTVAKCGISIGDLHAAVLGSTGAGRQKEAKWLENRVKTLAAEKNYSIKNFKVVSDAFAALEGAFAGKAGSILIAGTGSIMFGKDKYGNIYRTGGFGRFLGDEGSGYTIGRLGLTAVAKDLDSRGAHTLLTRFVAEDFGIDSPDILIRKVYNEKFDIASAAPSVLKAAEEGDDISLKIIDEQCTELMTHIYAMKVKMKVRNLDVSFAGRLLTSENIFSKTLRGKIQKESEGISLKEPEYPPEIGAALIAKNIVVTNDEKN